MNDSIQIRAALAEEGWTSHDKLTTEGWGNKVGYSIWFERWDWHGRHCGSRISFHAHTSDMSRVEDAIAQAAARAHAAWEQFPTEFPSQSADERAVIDPTLRGLWATARQTNRSTRSQV